jgi:hypothetical protein
MKKFAIAMLTALSFGVFAADFVSVSVEHVTDRASSAKSTVEYVRAGKEINGLQYGLQSRTARSNDGTGLYSSLEGSVGKNFAVAGLTVTPFVGAGRDLSKNGATEPYSYGFVGTNVGTPVLGGYALTGFKSRAGSTENTGRTKQTLMYAEYSYPVVKNVFVTAGVTRSTQDIRERAVALGVAVGF